MSEAQPTPTDKHGRAIRADSRFERSPALKPELVLANATDSIDVNVYALERIESLIVNPDAATVQRLRDIRTRLGRFIRKVEGDGKD
jgi:hypothetical protein